MGRVPKTATTSVATVAAPLGSPAKERMAGFTTTM